MKYRIFSIAVCLVTLMPMQAEVIVQADRPGACTGTTVLERGIIQWETGFEFSHADKDNTITLPTTLFRFGLCDWAEIRFEYTGQLALDATRQYTADPLNIGAKFKLYEGSEAPKLRWLPAISTLINIGLPLTQKMAQEAPISPTIDLLFDHDITDWFALGYNVGAHWDEWRPAPNIFAGIGLYFAPTEELGVYVENYNNFDCTPTLAADGYDTEYDVNIEVGLSYAVHPRVQLDCYGGINAYHTDVSIAGPGKNYYVGVGVAIAFGNRIVQTKPLR